MSQKEGEVPQLLLERLARGEMECVEDAWAERLAGLDPAELEARLEELRAQDARDLEAYPFDAVMGGVKAVSPRRARRAPARVGWFVGASAIAAAAAVALMWAPGAGVEEVAGPVGPDEVVRIKGAEPKVTLWLKASEGAMRLEHGAKVAEADVVQVRYASGGQPHGVILSLDGRGVVMLHHPSEPEGSSALEQGGSVELEHGYRLDDAPKYERFFMVTATAPLDAGRVSEVLEREGAAGAVRAWENEGYGVDEFTLEKVTR